MIKFTADGLELKYNDERDAWLSEGATQYMRSLSGTFDMVVDVGAHCGSLAIYAAKFRAKKVIAFEPVSQNVRCLVKNIELNSIDNLDIYCVALTAEKGIRTLARSLTDTTGQYSLYNKTGEVISHIDTLPFIDTLKKFIPIDYLKIDIEGAEFECIKCSKQECNELFKYVQYIDIDIHSPDNKDYYRAEWPFDFSTYKTRELATRTLIEFLQRCGFEDMNIQQCLSDFPPGLRSKNHFFNKRSLLE